MKAWIWLLAVLGLSAAAGAGDLDLRQIPLAGHGTFDLLVPRDWRSDVSQPAGLLPPTVRLTPIQGQPFVVLITPLWPAQSEQTLRQEVQHAAESAQPKAVERTLRVREIGGKAGPGFYFSATDKAPQPGEYKYLVQGMRSVAGLTLTFTILTNDGQQGVVDAALAIIRSAAHGNPGAT